MLHCFQMAWSSSKIMMSDGYSVKVWIHDSKAFNFREPFSVRFLTKLLNLCVLLILWICGSSEQIDHSLFTTKSHCGVVRG